MSNAEGQFILIDSHCHLDINQFTEDRDAVVVRAGAAGVHRIVIPAIEVGTLPHLLAVAERYAGVYAAVGVHPNSADQFTAATVDTLRTYAAHDKVVAVGEIGLDYYWHKVEPEQQKRVFTAQLALAAELGLPVIIHSRDANDDVAAVLRTWVVSDEFRRSPLAERPFAGVLHAFSGDLALAEEAYSWNFVLSLGGPVTYKNAAALHVLAPQLRLDRLMLETDAPYLTPHPHRGQRNEPAYVALVCERLAELYRLPAAQIAAVTTNVALRFFSLEESIGADVRSGFETVYG